MTVSRVLPNLIKLNNLIKFSSVARKPLITLSSPSVIELNSGAFHFLKIRTMSTDLDKELNDPKRHFDYNQLIAKKEKGDVIIIDVREHSEINETGKIPGSIHIPLNTLEHALKQISSEEFLKLYKSEKPKKDEEIIFTCRSGRRSLTAMKLADLGKALNDMSQEEFKKVFQADKPSKEKEIIFSCKAGGRSLKALKIGLELGYSKAGNYKGGWLDWVEKTSQLK